QSVERVTRNEQVRSSILLGGSASAPAVTTPSRCRVSLQHLAGDPASGVGGGEAGVAAGVVDDLSDLVLGQPVVAGDLDVELESSSVARSAIRMPSVTRLRSRRLSPSRPQSRPKTLSIPISSSSSPNLPSRRSPSGTAPESNSRNTWRPCSRTAVMPSSLICALSQAANYRAANYQAANYRGATNPTGPEAIHTDNAAVFARTVIASPAPGSRTKTRFSPGLTGTFVSLPSESDIVIEPSLLAR